MGEKTKTPRTDAAENSYESWESDCRHSIRPIRMMAQNCEPPPDGWEHARQLETDLQNLARVAGEAGDAIKWALSIIGEPRRIIGQNDSHCDSYEAAVKALSEINRIKNQTI